MRNQLPQFVPATNSLCLCGSGKMYKNCCMGRLPGTSLGDRTRKLIAAKNYDEALRSCRADVTQYTIWHKSHTEPALLRGMPRTGTIFALDVKALAELVDLLLWCHVRVGRVGEFSQVLDRLRSNVTDGGWQRKITYFHAVCALWPDWDEERGRRELRKLGGIAEEDDVEILQMHLDLFRSELSFFEALTLIEKILLLDNSPQNCIHYKCAKAGLLFGVNDLKSAKSELEDIYENFSTKSDLNAHAKFRLALSISFLGALKKDSRLFDDAIQRAKALLDDDVWSPSGRADILSFIGENYRYKGEWEEASIHYRRAQEINHRELNNVFMAECLLHTAQFEAAANLIKTTDVSALDDAGKIDYSFVFSSIALEMETSDMLLTAKDHLQAAPALEPAFTQQRDNLLFLLHESLNARASKTLINKTRERFREISRSALSYLILKPNFMGVGVDVGKVLEDLSKKRP